MNLSSLASTPASLHFDLDFNPVLPLPGSGPSEVTVEVDGATVPYARYTNTQNPNYLRAGTEWVHGATHTPQFAPTADKYAAVLREAAAALERVPGDQPEDNYTGNGRFELSYGGRTYTGSLLFEHRGPVRDAVNALRDLARDLKHGVEGSRNSV